MSKSYSLPASSKAELYQIWLVTVNWMLGKNQLTDMEIEILSYLLYYNDKYSTIPDIETRNELLFSTSVKKKIREEFKIETTKFETYLNKLRKKGIIKNNIIDPRLIVNITDKLEVTFNIHLLKQEVNQEIFVPPTSETIEQVTSTPTQEIIEYQKEEIIEEGSTSTSIDSFRNFRNNDQRPQITVDYNL